MAYLYTQSHGTLQPTDFDREVDKGFENSAPVEDDVPAVVDLEDMMLLALEADSGESRDDSDGDNDNVEGEVSNQYACACMCPHQALGNYSYAINIFVSSV